MFVCISAIFVYTTSLFIYIFVCLCTLAGCLNINQLRVESSLCTYADTRATRERVNPRVFHFSDSPHLIVASLVYVAMLSDRVSIISTACGSANDIAANEIVRKSVHQNFLVFNIISYIVPIPLFADVIHPRIFWMEILVQLVSCFVHTREFSFRCGPLFLFPLLGFTVAVF